MSKSVKFFLFIVFFTVKLLFLVGTHILILSLSKRDKLQSYVWHLHIANIFVVVYSKLAGKPPNIILQSKIEMSSYQIIFFSLNTITVRALT